MLSLIKVTLVSECAEKYELELSRLSDGAKKVGELVPIGETRSLSAVTDGDRFETLGNSRNGFDSVGASWT